MYSGTDASFAFAIINLKFILSAKFGITDRATTKRALVTEILEKYCHFSLKGGNITSTVLNTDETKNTDKQRRMNVINITDCYASNTVNASGQTSFTPVMAAAHLALLITTEPNLLRARRKSYRKLNLRKQTTFSSAASTTLGW